MKLGCVFFCVEGESTHWQQVAAGFNGWHVVDETARENKEEGEGLGIGAEAAGRWSAKTQDAAHALEIGRVAVAGGACCYKNTLREAQGAYVTAPNLLRAPKPPISITSSPLTGELKTAESAGSCTKRNKKQRKASRTHPPVAIEHGAIAIRKVKRLIGYVFVGGGEGGIVEAGRLGVVS